MSGTRPAGCREQVPPGGPPLPNVDRLKADPSRRRNERQLGHLSRWHERQVPLSRTRERRGRALTFAFARGRGPSPFLSYCLEPLECHAPVEAPVPEALRSCEVGVRQSQLGPAVGANEGEFDLGDILRRFRLL